MEAMNRQTAMLMEAMDRQTARLMEAMNQINSQGDGGNSITQPG